MKTIILDTSIDYTGWDINEAGSIEMTDWQPIETAPKDYTYVLLWNGSWHWIGIWDEDSGIQWDGERHEDLNPTHWMPLPPPPKKGDE